MNLKSFKNSSFLLCLFACFLWSVGQFFSTLEGHEARLIRPQNIEISSENGSQMVDHLPYLLQYNSSGLRTHHIRFKLPALDAAQKNNIGFFSPQILHGGEYYLNGHLIYQQAGSTSETRYAWYQPLWIPLPPSALQASGENTVDIRMHSYQRGFVAPNIYIAPWAVGQSLYDSYFFLSSTLVSATNLFSWLVGLFMISIWMFTDRSGTGRLFGYAGGATFLWASLFTLALWSELPLSLWLIWRFCLYTFTGGLVLLMSLFLFEHAQTALSRRSKAIMLMVSVGTPFLFLIWGRKIEFILDMYWTGFVILLYVVAIVNLIHKRWRQLDLLTVVMIVHSMVATVFAFHDYGVQSGPLLTERKQFIEWGIPKLFLEPIYLSHLTLPVLLIITGIILLRIHLQNVVRIRDVNMVLQHELTKRESELSIAHAEQQKIVRVNAINHERNRILQDIHDGLGSKLINILLELRMKSMSQNSLILDIQSCIDDLRIIVNGQFLDEMRLSEVLMELCERASRNMASMGCSLSYEFDAFEPQEVDSDQCLAILRITQEMLSNTLKHAKASESVVRLTWAPARDHLQLEIFDNGVGFDVSQVQRHMKRGMRGIHERLRKSCNFFELRSQPGCTQLTASIPCRVTASLTHHNVHAKPPILVDEHT